MTPRIDELLHHARWLGDAVARARSDARTALLRVRPLAEAARERGRALTSAAAARGRDLGAATSARSASAARAAAVQSAIAAGALHAWLRASGAAIARHARAHGRHPALLAALLAATPLLLVLAAVGAIAHHVYLDRSQLPALDPFIRFELPSTGHVYDAQGKVLIELAREYRRQVSYDEVPPVLRDAILAAEDKNFFRHSGVDYAALPRVIAKTARASLAGLWHGEGLHLRFRQGGSTLTQQLVRGYFLPDWTRREDDAALLSDGLAPRALSIALGVPRANKLLRKLEEIRLTLWLEQEMEQRYGSREQAKREIFARYASLIYLGNGRYGFAAASKFYFDVPLSSYTEQDAARAALLAGIIKSPRDYDPLERAARAEARRNDVLSLMARNGSIPAELAQRCRAEPIQLAERAPLKTNAPAAIETVFNELNEHGAGRFGVEDLFQGRVSVEATVDERVQVIANEALENGIARYRERHPGAIDLPQGSVVVLRNSDGAILAETGGRPVYGDRAAQYSDYNRVTDSLRQPGSTMKPLVYLAAFREGLDLDTLVPDEPFGMELDGKPGLKWLANYDNRFQGPMPMRQALAESSNVAAAWLVRQIGLGPVLETARALGIHTPLQVSVGTALGVSEVRLLELASAYRAMASGLLAEPHVIARVTDASGATLYEAPREVQDIRTAGLSPGDLALIQEGLRGAIRLPTGTARALSGRSFPIPVMGKTGTTSDYRDALFVGSTYGPEGITVAVRLGFDDNRELGSGESGGRAALPIFREIVLRAYQDQLVGPVPKFPSEIERGIDDYLALLKSSARDTPLEPPRADDSERGPFGFILAHRARREEPAPAAVEDPRQHEALRRRLEAAEVYVLQSESRLRAAEEHWAVVSNRASRKLVLQDAEQRLEIAAQALEHAIAYRDSLARRTGAPPPISFAPELGDPERRAAFVE